MELIDALRARSATCELCGSDADLSASAVPPGDPSVDRAVLSCGPCSEAIAGGEVAGAHWFCLRESIWSEVPAVQVVSWRLIHKLGTEPWAIELLEQVYLDEETLAWAQQGLSVEEAVVVVDSNGTPLADGDSVTLIKDLDVKGANFTAKRGTLVKNIRLGSDPTHVEGRVNKTGIYLKTEFLKKA